jgi:hypothetical protein
MVLFLGTILVWLWLLFVVGITSPLGDGDGSLVGDFGIIVCSVVAQDQDLQNVDALYFKVWLNTSKVQ